MNARHIFGILFFIPTLLNASVHTVPPVNAGLDGGFSVQATITGATRTAFKEDFDEDGDGLWKYPLALYTTSGSANLRIDVEYHGSVPVEQVKVNGQEGYSITYPIELSADQQGLNCAYGVGLITVSGFYVEQRFNDSTGETWDEYIPFRFQFQHEVRFYKELWIELRMPITGFRWVVESRRIAPFITTTSDGFDRVNIGWSAWPDVGVQINSTGQFNIEPSGWLRTDQFGRASIKVRAPLSAFSDDYSEGRWYHEEVEIRAVKGSCQIEALEGINVPFCVVVLANRAWLKGNVDALGGEDPLPLAPSMLLRNGDRVQVGTAILSGFLRVQFANGFITELEATGLDGFGAIIGVGDVTIGRSLISLYIQNTFYDIRTDPRRFARMAVYKGVGTAVDNALGVPDVVGFVSDTPGSLVEKAFIKWVESNYKYIAPKPPKQQGMMAFSALQKNYNNCEEPLLGQVKSSSYMAVELFTDGSLRVENYGEPLEFSTPEGLVQPLPTSGASWINRTSEETLVPSMTITPPSVWNLEINGDWTHSPALNEIVASSELEFSIGHENASHFRWENAVVRLDGRNITELFESNGTLGGDDFYLFCNLPIVYELEPGFHQLRVDIEDRSGERHELQIPFIYSPPGISYPAPDALPLSNGVWLRWSTEILGIDAVKVWRRVQPNQPAEVLAQLQNGGFWDESPVPEAAYWLEYLDADGQVVGISEECLVSWNADLPHPPAAENAGLPVVENTAAGLRIRLPLESNPGRQRWQLQSSDTESGPFVDIFPNEYHVPQEWVDVSVPVGATRYYKLLALSLDGIAQEDEPMPVSAINRVEPFVPQGFSLHRSATHYLLQWNPVDDVRTHGIRVYQVVEQSPVLLAELSADVTSYLVANTSAGTFFLTAVSSTGVESSASLLLVSDWHSPVNEPAVISMAVGEITVREGDGVCTLTVQRSGNLDEPVFVPWTLRSDNYPYVTFGEDLDFRSEFLAFAAGQTEASITLPIHSDDQDEQFEFVSVVFGNPQGPVMIDVENGITQVRIEESDLFLFANYQIEARVGENAGSALITLERLWPSNRDVSAQLVLANPSGSAVSGVDFLDASPWIFTFAAGESQSTIEIPLIDNAVKDGHRTLILALSSPTGGSSIASGYDQFTYTIRDDETQPGEFQPVNAQQVFIATGDQIHIPLERIGGSDGMLGVMGMPNGGSLGWGSLMIGSAEVGEGELHATLSVTMDRDVFQSESPGLAPFAVVSIFSGEESYSTRDVLILFPPGDGAGSFSQWWEENMGAPPPVQTASPFDDSNFNGLPDFAEIALGLDPTVPQAAPSILGDTSFGLTLEALIHVHPRLVVVGEFSKDLKDGFPMLHGGFWYPDGSDAAEAHFSNFVMGAKSMFGRLRFYWMGE